MADKLTETVERIDQRLFVLEQLYPGTNKVFADRDGEWSLPSLRQEIRALAALSRPNVDEMRGALGELEQRATAALSAMDRYNEENGTHIIGPSLLQLGKSIARARAALRGSADNG